MGANTQRRRGRQQGIFPNALKKDAGTEDMHGRSWRLEDLYKDLTGAALVTVSEWVSEYVNFALILVLWRGGM